MIMLEVTDAKTGQVTIVNQTPHDAKKLYLALREVFGDMKTGAVTGEIITVPQARIKA